MRKCHFSQGKMCGHHPTRPSSVCVPFFALRRRSLCVYRHETISLMCWREYQMVGDEVLPRPNGKQWKQIYIPVRFGGAFFMEEINFDAQHHKRQLIKCFASFRWSKHLKHRNVHLCIALTVQRRLVKVCLMKREREREEIRERDVNTQLNSWSSNFIGFLCALFDSPPSLLFLSASNHTTSPPEWAHTLEKVPKTHKVMHK